MPSEDLASPEGRCTVPSATSVDRADIDKTTDTIESAESISAEEDAQSASESVSKYTAMNHMVDNIVGSEAAANCEDHEPNELLSSRVPPTPPSYSFEDSPVNGLEDDTNYSLLGTSTANELAHEVSGHSPHGLQQDTPRPPVSKVYNSPFAPASGGLVSPRPNTANRNSPFPLPRHSDTRNSIAAAPMSSQQQYQQHPQPSGITIPSSISSMQDPSSFLPGSLYNRGYAAQIQSAGPGVSKGGASAIYGNESAFDESLLMSAYLFGSSERNMNDEQEPPNGQGG